MFEFWAVIGRVCLDEAFHRQAFNRVDHTLPFEDLDALTEFLRVTNELPLGRWEIAELNRIIAGNYDGDNYTPHTNVEDDHEVAAIRLNQPRRDLPFPADLSFCAAFGLTCVDTEFRALVVLTATAELLREVLMTAAVGHPKIILTSAEAALLQNVVRAKEGPIGTFHEANWIIPARIACSAGYSLKAVVTAAEQFPTYLHVSQPGVIALLGTRPDLLELFLGNQVVQGDATALRQLFPA